MTRIPRNLRASRTSYAIGYSPSLKSLLGQRLSAQVTSPLFMLAAIQDPPLVATERRRAPAAWYWRRMDKLSV